MRLGIDIGGTKTAAVAIGADGELSDQVRMPTGFGAEAVVATALRTVERMTRARRRRGIRRSPRSASASPVPSTARPAASRTR